MIRIERGKLEKWTVETLPENARSVGPPSLIYWEVGEFDNDEMINSRMEEQIRDRSPRNAIGYLLGERGNVFLRPPGEYCTGGYRFFQAVQYYCRS